VFDDVELTRQTLRAALDDPGGVLAAIRDELRLMRQESAQGRSFTDIATGLTDGAGAAQVPIDGPRVGQIWLLERISVVVAGASAAANVALYLDAPAADVDLLDYANAMLGNTPSRVVFAAPGGPYLIPNGTPVIVAVAGAAPAAAVSIRYQGRVVEVETSGGRV
jgi:hypothetical protein